VHMASNVATSEIINHEGARVADFLEEVGKQWVRHMVDAPVLIEFMTREADGLLQIQTGGTQYREILQLRAETKALKAD